MKIAIITGANRGIGYETARQLDQKGWQVILCSRKFRDGKAAARSLSNAIPFQLDVTDLNSISELVSHLRNRFDRIDVLINNAGLGTSTQESKIKQVLKNNVAISNIMANKAVSNIKKYMNLNQEIKPTNIDLEGVRLIFETNFFGPWMMIQKVIPLLKNSLSPRIINVSSGLGASAELSYKYSGYSLSKAALNNLTIVLSQEFENQKILVNSVCPGWVKTRMGGQNAPREVEQGADSIVWLATSDDIPHGKFIRDRQVIQW